MLGWCRQWCCGLSPFASRRVRCGLVIVGATELGLKLPREAFLIHPRSEYHTRLSMYIRIGEALGVMIMGTTMRPNRSFRSVRSTSKKSVFRPEESPTGP